MQEITVVGFAGGGGSCEGIRNALGRSPDVALNHDEVAVAVHTANHPDTIHYCQNIWKANPGDVLHEVKTKRGLKRKPKIGLAWFSPDCKHFSKAKGGKPVEKRIRDLAWVILAWAKLPDAQRPRVIMVENVEEFITWGPLAEDGRPCPERGGEYFKKWFAEFKRLGYKGEHREVVAANKGTPTTRKRLFVIFRNDGLPIVWPEDTHGKPTSPHVITGHRKPWRAAAEIIDWSLPCPSIFDTSEQIMAKHGVRAIRPLAPNTMARIARGIRRYVLDAAEPFIVPVSHSGDIRVHGLDEPLRTVTGSSRSGHALITPFVTYAQQGGAVRSAGAPLHTITASRKDANCIIAPTLICTGNGERAGQDPRARDIKSPFTTVTANGSQGALVTAFLAQQNSGMVGHSASEPVSTIVQKGCTQTLVQVGLSHVGNGNDVGARQEWSVPGSEGRDDLANEAKDSHRHLRGDQATPGGERSPQRLPNCDDRNRAQDGGGLRASPRLDDLQGANTGRTGDQPRGRGEGTQRTVQPRPDDALGKSPARASNGPSSEPALRSRGDRAEDHGPARGQDGLVPSSQDAGHEPHDGSASGIEVSAGLINLKGSDRRQSPVDQPCPTQTAQGWHIAEVRAFLMSYHRDGGQYAECDEPTPTIDTRGRYGLVTVMIGGEPYAIVDIGMRMLTPRELFRAQGFGDSYIIDRGLFADGWRPITKTAQIRLCGNAVCPQVAEALVTANYTEFDVAENGLPEFALQAAE